MLILVLMMVWVLGTVFSNMWLSSFGISLEYSIPASISMTLGAMILLVLAYVGMMSLGGFIVLLLERQVSRFLIQGDHSPDSYRPSLFLELFSHSTRMP